jgi:phage shock protein E
MLLRFITLIIFSLTSMAMVVVDVRTEAEWNTGHLEGALHIEWQDILKISSSIRKDEEIFLYCRSGNRSGKATKILIDAGYINAKNAGSIADASETLGIKIID